MRQAIVTKYLGPTNTRGARVKATADAGSATIGWDHALNSEQNHENAAMRLAFRLQWLGADLEGRFSPKAFRQEWVAGGLPDNTGNVYVQRED